MDTPFLTRSEHEAFVQEYQYTLGDISVALKKLLAFAEKHERDVELHEAAIATIQAQHQFLMEDMDA